MAATTPTPDAELVERRIQLALSMLDRGAWIFPLAQNSKKPLVPKAQGGEGFKDARPDRDMAETFLRNPGQPNYGVVFPEGSDVFVLDLDGGGDAPRPEWREDWQKLYERYGPPGLTFIVKTPSGGRHAYYRWRADLYGPMPLGDEMLGWTVRKPWKGYLVGPGSVVSGIAYEPAGIDRIADFPDAWSRAALGEDHPEPTTPGSPFVQMRGPGQVQQGKRHAYLRNQARYLVGVGLSGDALVAAVMSLNSKLPQPKTAEEVLRAIGEAEGKFEPDEVADDGRRVARSFDDELGLLPPIDSGDFPAPPDPEAFEGLLGECVADLAPGTDASLVGLLVSLIAFAGALVPGRAYFHRPQTTSPYIALVGESSVGRKGTAMTRVHDAVSQAIEPVYVNRAIADGLNSGEALVTHIADKQEWFPHEPAVALIYGEEYAGLMASRQREGSTLDPKMREAFDGGPLANRRSSATNTKAVKADSYWVPALVAITPSELRAKQEAGGLQSGSANRWLYVPVTRRETEPLNTEPRFSPDNAEALVAARRAALANRAQKVDVPRGIVRGLNDYDDWLRSIASGTTQDLSRRFSVIAFRIALVHAMVDQSSEVSLSHLRRALALTEYARQGIRWIFGPAFGSPDAVLLSRHLQEARRLTKSHITRQIIRDPIRQQAAIDELVRMRLAQVATVHGASGRPKTELVRVISTISIDSSFRMVERPQILGNLEVTESGLGKNLEITGKNVEESGNKSTPWCHFFVDHQSQHRDVSAEPWCAICTPRGTP